MPSVAQRSFAGGEIAPSLYGRTDQQKYATGLRTCRNFLVQRHGGVTNRPGLALVAETKNSGAVRLLKFVYSPDPDQVYVLEFGDRYMRVHQDGGQVVVSGVSAWVTATDYTVGDLVSRSSVHYYCKVAHTSGATTEPASGTDWTTYWHALSGTIYEIPTPYLAADVAELQYVQSGDVVTIVHPDYAPRNLSRTAHTRWTLETVNFGASIQAPASITLGGGPAGTETYWYAVTAVDVNGNESAPCIDSIGSITTPTASDPVTVDWDPVANAVSYRVYRSTDGVTFGRIGLAGGTASASSDTSWGTASSTVSTALTGTEVVSGTPAVNQIFSGAAGEKAASGDYEVNFDITLAMDTFGDTGTARAYAYYKRGSETPVAYGLIGELPTPGTQSFSATINVPDNGYDTLEIQIYAAVTGESSSGFTTYDATVTGTSIAWDRGATGVGDTGTAADTDQAPPAQAVGFNATGRYPAAVNYYQQRRCFASSSGDPEKVWGSRTGDYANFGISTPLQDDDAVSFSLVGQQVNQVRWLVDLLDYLYVGTTGGIHEIRGDEAGVLKPSAINPHKRSYHGVSALGPFPITDALIYIQERGGMPRDFRPNAPVGENDRDLSIFASHLFDGYTIVDGDYQPIPHSRLWLVRSDGVLLGLTYIREHEVWGWDRHDTAGAFENVVVVPEGNEDRVYVVVNRTINGSTKRFIERMAVRTITAVTDTDDLFFVDSGLSYDGAAATTFTGLSHLEGEEVAVFADGAVVASPDNPDLDPITVTGGQITLPTAASVVHVGLPYRCDLETLDLDTPSGASLKASSKVNINKATLLLERSMLSSWIGQRPPTDDGTDPLEHLRVIASRDVTTTDGLSTGTAEVQLTADYNTNGRVFLRHVDPSPVTVLGIFPEGYVNAPR